MYAARLRPLTSAAFAFLTPLTQAQPSAPEVVMPRVEVIGNAERLTTVPGSAEVIDSRTLESSRVFTVNEALRKVPGINVRDEEGFGLRPNIGIRGLNPTRSTKVTLLEDGIPLAYAPYGDNASYYHPPIDRFERIEVLKGAGQILFGPQTIGGVINYITPTPPQEFGGFVSGTLGNRDFFNGKVRLGGRGMLLDFTRKQGDGARDNINSEINDINFKWVLALGRRSRCARTLTRRTPPSPTAASPMPNSPIWARATTRSRTTISRSGVTAPRLRTRSTSARAR